ncbi:MAG: protein-glutamate O-methyltransferase CheR [Desulfobacteraceae bacterium]
MEISPGQFRKLADLVYEEAGIRLTDQKYELLKSRLAKRLRKTGFSLTRDYIEFIGRDRDEFNRFIDAITTNHTFFFRENAHCEYIISNIPSSSFLKIWCAACSSGEEPYSLALQLIDNNYRIGISATDLSDTMLDKARKGIFPMERVNHVPQYLLRRYFQKGSNRYEGQVKVKKEIRELVQFSRFNLITDAMNDRFDIIFCRNVMIYFDAATRQKTVDTLVQSLKPGGILFTGMSESLNGISHPLKQVMSSAYKKV